MMKRATCAVFAAVVLSACGHGGAAAPAATGGDPAGGGGGAVQRPPSAKVDKKQAPAMADCHRSYKPTSGDKDLAADVTAMAQGCAEATKMHVVGATLSGSRAEGAPATSFPLDAQAGHCYRVYAISESTLQDLDLALVDSTGGLAGEDSTDDVSPVLLEDGALCFKVADKAHVEVTGGAGGGKFALQIWSD